MFKRKLEEIGSYVYRHTLFRIKKVLAEQNTKSILKQNAYFNQGTVIMGHNYIGKGTYLSNVQLGYGAYINDRGRLKNVKIGKYTSIGTDVQVILGSHPAGTFVAMHPAFYSASGEMGFTYRDETVFSEFRYVKNEPGFQVVIGNDVWIGNGVSIMEGVTIGDGAIIGAGSIVTKDAEAYGIYAGVPAKKIGDRFSDIQIQFLTHFKWWEKDELWLMEHVKEFDNIELFIKENQSL